MSAKKLVRLQKFLSEQGVCSRRKAEELIFAKKILVNDKLAQIGQKVSGEEKILVNGKPIIPLHKKTILLAWHKPLGVEITFQKKINTPTILDFDFGLKKTITVGRLDKNSRGLLLITNNGDLANYLAHPKNNHKKEYLVEVNRELNKNDLEKLGNGSIVLGGKKVHSCPVKKIGPRKFKIILTEGRNRQIRRMCEACGLKVEDLLRTKFNNWELGDLPSGKFREISIITDNLFD